MLRNSINLHNDMITQDLAPGTALWSVTTGGAEANTLDQHRDLDQQVPEGLEAQAPSVPVDMVGPSLLAVTDNTHDEEQRWVEVQRKKQRPVHDEQEKGKNKTCRPPPCFSAGGASSASSACSPPYVS